MKKLIYNFFHIFDILILPICIILVGITWICLYITKNDIKYPEQREVVIDKMTKLYPKNIFKVWLSGFKQFGRVV